METLNLSEIKEISVDTLDYIVSVCEENNIKYFLAFGTLLGAVRHQGFIPWDDDIDIALLRPDYDRLINLLLAEKNEKYKLLLRKYAGVNFPVAYLMNTETKILNEGDIKIKDNRGIKVDIFSLDGFCSRNSLRALCIKILYYGMCFNQFDAMPQKKNFGFLLYVPWKLCRGIGKHFFSSNICRLLRVQDFKKFNFVAHEDSITVSYPKSIFESTIDVEFEGKFYKAPIGYKDYLKIAYGDYMQLPPEEKRITHKIKAIRLK